ncbi:sensor domain-containing diguanylate cyclase [Pseudoduganella sp. SL102]|uniref:GGDEF domain-containing protein n=1 Tax=Pseudoduganella sp. SL102 TaxID=2995154 RepID=UPI00248C79E8|nr:sensor domain-containing diguanylate cyclase [Pseudoduganella sp. SL102]WBS05233.1 sensor domain-containing diguanylate cyclase [Pseudoduganella sp. SL102]
MSPTPDNPAAPFDADSHASLPALWRHPVIRLVIVVTVLACLALAGFSAWFMWSARQAQIQQTRVATSNVARMVGAQVESAMKTASMALSDMAERAKHEGTGEAARERLRTHLGELAKVTPELYGMFLYGPDGSWLATSLGREVQGNNADRAYFQYHRTHQDEGIHIAAPVKSKSTGVWIIPVSRGIYAADGTFMGVALVTLRLNFFERIYDELDIGRTGVVLLMLYDGTVIYRRPFDEKLIGTDLSNGNIFKELRKRPVGSTFLVAKVDKVERLYSYRRLQNFPFLVSVGQTKAELLGDWKRSSMLIGVAVLLISAMLATFATKLVRQIAIRDRLDAQLRLYSGELEKRNVDLRMLAHTDQLTQLANRRRFDEVLDKELRRAQRGRTPLSLIMLDLDFFKQFNDRYGHLAGDECLQRAAGVLSDRILRAGDVAARYGGEEFAVIMPNTGEDGAMAVAEQVRAGIMALGIPHEHSPGHVVTASLGVATLYPGKGGNATGAAAASELIGSADRHLYDAKQAGRNQVRGESGSSAAGTGAAAANAAAR